MSSVFAKLNLKDQPEVLIVNAPASFEAEIRDLKGVRVTRDARTAKEITFALAFITKQKELDELAAAISKKAKGDAVVWFAYPKKTSKQYTCEIDRDHGWDVLGKLGFEGVRMIAIDDDWTAKRVRRAEYIKVLSGTAWGDPRVVRRPPKAAYRSYPEGGPDAKKSLGDERRRQGKGREKVKRVAG
jgi:hypothetical protein